MNNSPYQCLKQELLCKWYSKVDVILINEKINILKAQITYEITPRQIKLAKMLNQMYKNRDFIIRQINQQMMERT